MNLSSILAGCIFYFSSNNSKFESLYPLTLATMSSREGQLILSFIYFIQTLGLRSLLNIRGQFTHSATVQHSCFFFFFYPNQLKHKTRIRRDSSELSVAFHTTIIRNNNTSSSDYMSCTNMLTGCNIVNKYANMQIGHHHSSIAFPSASLTCTHNLTNVQSSNSSSGLHNRQTGSCNVVVPILTRFCVVLLVL